MSLILIILYRKRLTTWRSPGNKPSAKRKGKANDNRGSLMANQSSSTSTTASNPSGWRNSSPITASALLTLSGSGFSSWEDDYFSLKSLKGTQVRILLRLWSGYASTTRSSATSTRLICGKQRNQILQEARWITLSVCWAPKLPLPPKAKKHSNKTSRLTSINCEKSSRYEG